MHPILAARGRILSYLLGWVPILALLVYVTWAAGGTSWTSQLPVLGPACVVFAFACLSPWSICRVRPLRLVDVTVLAITWTAAAAAGSGVLVSSAWILAAVEGRVAAHLDLLFVIGMILYLLSAGLHYAALAAEASREAGRRATEARILARDAQLQALRMQINPHFLFNSLHSIAALAGADGARARDMCVLLSDFLRSSLGLGERESIPLGEELALARSYLEVERVRFGERLRVREEIEPACEQCAVPALLLQPLMENAVKHGIAGMLQGGAIRLTAQRRGGDVVIAVENAFDPDVLPSSKLGLGLAHVRRRLQVRYGEDGGFLAFSRDGIYRVELRFPCESPIASSSRA
jgi:two-component system, LytTR family, sensor histidine kinase AlgZ